MITDLTPEQILAANVDSHSQPEQEGEMEQKIRKATRPANFTMQLSQHEVEYLHRCAAVTDQKWETFLKMQIREKILQRTGHVAAPLITSPSFAANRISGPSTLS